MKIQKTEKCGLDTLEASALLYARLKDAVSDEQAGARHNSQADFFSTCLCVRTFAFRRLNDRRNVLLLTGNLRLM